MKDFFEKKYMGECAEKIAAELGISRKEQDEEAILSYNLAREAHESGKFEQEISEVEWDGKIVK